MTIQIRFGLSFEPQWLYERSDGSRFPFQHWNIWSCTCFYFTGTLCVPGPQWPSSLYLLRLRPNLNLQSNGWHMRCQFHFHVRRRPFHVLLGRVLLYLVHLILHVLCYDLCHWNVHLFRRHGLHGQKHKHYAFWSGLMKSWNMDIVLQPL